jgi:hypothetical protein
MSEFIGDLVVRLVNDDASGLWELVQPFGFRSDVAGRVIMAPAGHRTDFCSVPRVPLAYVTLGNRARRAGTIHDRLYVTHELPREKADEVLREMLLLDGVGHFEAMQFYLAVRAAGGTHWGPDPALS